MKWPPIYDLSIITAIQMSLHMKFGHPIKLHTKNLQVTVPAPLFSSSIVM